MRSLDSQFILFVQISLISLGASLATSASALEWLSVEVPAHYESNLTIPDVIRKDCVGLERTVGSEVAYQLEKSGFAKIDRVEIINLKRPGKLLTLSITQAAATNGQWLDPKSLTVKAELFENGKSFEWVIKTHTSRAQTDVCETMEKNAGDIAVEIYKWLTSTLQSKTLPASLNNTLSGFTSGSTLHQLQSQNIWINTNVQYAAADLRSQIVSDCGIETNLVDHTIDAFSKSLTLKRLAQINNADRDDDVLQFTILSVNGDATDAKIKSRKLAIKAEVLRDGTAVETFNGLHTSARGGIIGQVLRTTCDAMDSITKSMATDTYQWYLNLKSRNLSTQPKEN